MSVGIHKHIYAVSRLAVLLESQARLLDISDSRDSMIVACLIYLQESDSKLPTASEVAQMLGTGFSRRQVQDRLTALDSLNKVVKIDGTGRTPALYYVNWSAIEVWYEKRSTKELLETINSILVDTIRDLLPR